MIFASELFYWCFFLRVFSLKQINSLEIVLITSNKILLTLWSCTRAQRSVKKERSERIHSRSFTMQEVRLIGQKEVTSLGDFPTISNGIMMATLQIHGQSARWNDALNMKSNSWTAKGSSDLRNFGAMLSGAAAPLCSNFWSADIVQACWWRYNFNCQWMKFWNVSWENG